MPTNHNTPPLCNYCGTLMEPYSTWVDTGIYRTATHRCPFPASACQSIAALRSENEALRNSVSAAESRAQELETKLRAAEDAVVVLREAATLDCECDLETKCYKCATLADTSALAAQRKREIVREKLEANLPARRAGESYDLRSDGYQRGWNDCLDVINHTILNPTEPA